MASNAFGEIFRVTTWGESHGPAIGCVVDGCPPGLELTEADFERDIDRRRTGSRGTSRGDVQVSALTILSLSGVFRSREAVARREKAYLLPSRASAAPLVFFLPWLAFF